MTGLAGFKGMPFEIVEVLLPACWHGFARRRVEKVVFEWDVDAATSRKVVATSLEEEGWVWRGFYPQARVRVENPLQSGLTAGAQAVPVELSEVEDFG